MLYLAFSKWKRKELVYMYFTKMCFRVHFMTEMPRWQVCNIVLLAFCWLTMLSEAPDLISVLFSFTVLQKNDKVPPNYSVVLLPYRYASMIFFFFTELTWLKAGSVKHIFILIKSLKRKISFENPLRIKRIAFCPQITQNNVVLPNSPMLL